MNRREAFITGLVLGAFCLVVAAVLVSVRSDEPAEVVSAEPASTTTSPAPPVEGDELAAFVDEAIGFIEETRGRAFVDDPVVVTLSEEAFVARVRSDLTEDFAEDPEGVAVANAAYRAAALIGPDEDIVEVYRSFGEAGILGFYDPESDELVVRQRDELSLLTKSTIVHELTHAFDDQHFDLDRPEYDDRTDEVAWGFRAVAEGSASWVETQWKETLGVDEREELLREELGFGDPGIFDRFELAFLFLELSPYEFGEPFVDHLVDQGGNDALDGALEDPPVTSEQVISPDRYDAGEGPIEMPAPPAEGDVIYSGLGGQVLIDSLLGGVGVTRSFEWGGDQLVVWTAAGSSCLAWDIQAEDGATAAVERDFAGWADRVGGTTVSVVDERTVRVERCA